MVLRMSSSRWSGKTHHNKGHHGSGHYQRRGWLERLVPGLGSRSGSGYRRKSHGQHWDDRYEETPRISPGNSHEAVTCKNCRARIPAGSKFCLECGARVENGVVCPNCGEELSADAKFCNKCGTKVRN